VSLPTASVIVPCYNGRRFVADAVRSVLDQAAAGVECVIVDDGSKDGSPEFIEETFGPVVRVVRQKNAGAAAARNRGFAESTGELVIWLDADDTLAPGTLAGRRRAFADDSTLEMLVGQGRIVDVDTGEEEVSPQAPCGPDYLFRDLLNRRNLPHSNVLTFRRAAAARAGLYDTGLKIGEDFVFWVRAWATLRWRFVEEVQAIQRVGGFPSLSKSRGKFFFYDQVGEALHRVRPFLREHTGSDAAWRRAFAEYAADYALLHLNRGNRGRAWRWATRALAAAPLSPAGPRAARYWLAGSLPPDLYRLGQATAARFGVTGYAKRNGHAPAAAEGGRA
jgi:hypothetical protein